MAQSDYVFPAKDGDGNYTVVSHTIDLETPASGKLEFKIGNKQVVLVITLTVVKPTGVEETISVPLFKDHVDVYDLYGRLVRNQVDYRHALYGLPSGIYIVDGKKVNWWGF